MRRMAEDEGMYVCMMMMLLIVMLVIMMKMMTMMMEESSDGACWASSPFSSSMSLLIGEVLRFGGGTCGPRERGGREEG